MQRLTYTVVLASTVSLTSYAAESIELQGLLALRYQSLSLVEPMLEQNKPIFTLENTKYEGSCTLFERDKHGVLIQEKYWYFEPKTKLQKSLCNTSKESENSDFSFTGTGYIRHAKIQDESPDSLGCLTILLDKKYRIIKETFLLKENKKQGCNNGHVLASYIDDTLYKQPSNNHKHSFDFIKTSTEKRKSMEYIHTRV